MIPPFGVAIVPPSPSTLTGRAVGDFGHSFADAHLYVNHLDQARLQLEREPRALPHVTLNPRIRSVVDFRYEDVLVEGYDPAPAIRAPIAV